MAQGNEPATPGAVKANPRVTAYQKAARYYCKEIGANPDEVQVVPHPTIAGVNMQMPFWYLVAERIYDFAIIARSIGRQNQDLKAPSANDGGKNEVPS